MRDQRGVTFVEVLVTTLAAGIIFLGLSFVYEATSRTFADSNSQAALQGQGTLALQEIGQRVRSSTLNPSLMTTVACRGVVNSAQVTLAAPDIAGNTMFCYYRGSSGQLWQATPPAGGECTDTTCRNLLAEKLQGRSPGSTPISLWTQPPGLDSRCPATVPAGDFCFDMTADNPTQTTVAFAITDGVNIMPFRISLTCSGRNC